MEPTSQNQQELASPHPPSYSSLAQLPSSQPPPPPPHSAAPPAPAFAPPHPPSGSPSFSTSATPFQQHPYETPTSQPQNLTQDRTVRTKSPSSSRRAADSDARLRAFSSTSVQRHRLSNFSLSSEPPVSTPTRQPDDAPLPEAMKEMLTKMVEWKHKYPVMFSQVLQIFQGGTANSPEQSVASTPASASPSRTHSPPYEPGDDGPYRKQRRVYSLPGSRSRQGLIDGLPDLGKFPLYRRKRRTRKEIQADERQKVPERVGGRGKTRSKLGGELSQQDEDLDALHQPAFDTTTTTESNDAGMQHFLPPAPALAPEHIAQPVSTAGQEVNAQASLLHQPTETSPPTQQQTETQQQQQQDPQVQAQSGSSPKGPYMAINPKTIWPEPKKPAIASAASAYLNSLPFNRNKPCSSDFVLQLIEPNPSYIELCATLESHGFHLNTVHFAKHLLDSVPDLTNSGSYTTVGAPEAQQQDGKTTVPETISLL